MLWWAGTHRAITVENRVWKTNHEAEWASGRTGCWRVKRRPVPLLILCLRKPLKRNCWELSDLRQLWFRSVCGQCAWVGAPVTPCLLCQQTRNTRDEGRASRLYKEPVSWSPWCRKVRCWGEGMIRNARGCFSPAGLHHTARACKWAISPKARLPGIRLLFPFFLSLFIKEEKPPPHSGLCSLLLWSSLLFMSPSEDGRGRLCCPIA